MSQFLTWLEMGGYAIYVWSAYGFLFLVFVIHLLSIQFRYTRIWKDLKKESKQAPSE